MRSLVFLIFTITSFTLLHTSCSTNEEFDPYVIVLGIAQDGGAPQAGCMKNCCIDRWGDPEKRLLVSSIGIVDPKSDSAWIIDVTPDFPNQLKQLTNNDPKKFKGAFITHAHIGHYSGLIHFGREVMGNKNTPVYTMPKMTKFIKSNGPWSQLVKLKNVVSKINTKTIVETILVLDGTNGSNMIKQVEIFGKELNASCIIITKLDGTAKGGALISIANKYEIPISYVGLGEKPEDLSVFSSKNFARSILNLEE